MGLFDDDLMWTIFALKYGTDHLHWMSQKGYVVYGGQKNFWNPWNECDVDGRFRADHKYTIFLDDDLDEERAADLLQGEISGHPLFSIYEVSKLDAFGLADKHLANMAVGIELAKDLVSIAGDIGISFIPGESVVEAGIGKSPSGQDLKGWERAVAALPLIGVVKKVSRLRFLAGGRFTQVLRHNRATKEVSQRIVGIFNRKNCEYVLKVGSKQGDGTGWMHILGKHKTGKIPHGTKFDPTLSNSDILNLLYDTVNRGDYMGKNPENGNLIFELTQGGKRYRAAVQQSTGEIRTFHPILK